jgi:lipid-A-disaccharide synthase
MRIFLSAGEPSGDLHGSSLIRTLRRLEPGITCDGFGGERMEEAGCQLLYPLSRHAIMGITQALGSVPFMVRLLLRANRWFRQERPDAVVLIDYPGFHWWLARLAHAHGIPVFYFVPPQLWAWAGWRVRKMRRYVDHVLCNLPFEEAWYRERGVRAHWVGHPYFDEIAGQRLDRQFVESEQDRPGTIVGLLPGSRRQELLSNVPTLLRAAERIHKARPETRYLVACLKPEHAQYVEQHLEKAQRPFVEVHAGRTQEIICLAKACIAVSGSVGLELLARGTPSVVIYRARRRDLLLCWLLLTAPYISLVNLLAGKELFPEYLTNRCPAPEAAEHVLGWLNNPAAHAEMQRQVIDLRDRVAEPGACERAARFVLATLSERQKARPGKAA